MAECEHTTPSPEGKPVTGVEWLTPDIAVVTVSGEIDMATAPAMTRALGAALDKRPTMLVVDLTGVSFLGSAGLNALVIAEIRSGESCTLRIVAPSAVTRRPISMTGLDQTLTVVATRDDALAG